MSQRQRHSPLPDSLPPRGLDREQAASYLGVSPWLFVEMVGDGRMPRPKVINKRRVWDRFELDNAFSRLGSDEQPAADDPDETSRLLEKMRRK